MRKPLVLALLLFSFVVIGTGIFIAQKQAPKTEALSEDLREVRKQIKGAEDEAQRYSGGAIKTFIDLRTEILKNTAAMLDQKRLALVHFINIDYAVDGKSPEPFSQEQLSRIKKDIENTRADIESQRAKAAQYTGGLLKAVHLTAVATGEATLAALNMRYLTAKHGIPLFGLDPESRVDSSTKGGDEPTGKIVEDEEAL